MDLQHRLTEDDILYLQHKWLLSDTSYLNTALKCRSLHPFFKKLKDYEVLEIGSGDNPVTNHHPCKSYESASGYYPYDGLTVLKSKPDSSLVVVSFGVVESDVLVGSFETKESKSVRYARELAHEIKRVSAPFSIIFGNCVDTYVGKPDIFAIRDSPDFGGVYFNKQ